MALKVEKKRIGRYDYEVKQLGSEAGGDLFMHLMRIAGPALGALMAGKGTFEAVGPALVSASQNLEPADLRRLRETLGPQSRVFLGGTAPTLDMGFQDLHFAGEYLEMFEWIGFALEVNYRNFIDGLRRRLGSDPSPSTDQAQA